MNRRLRNDSGDGPDFEAAHVAIGRGMAEVLTALDNVIDDDAVLRRVHARLVKNSPVAAFGQGAGTVLDECTKLGILGSAGTLGRASGPAASRRRPAMRAVAAAAATALAAGAVALRAIGLPGAAHNVADGPPDRASYVVKRVGSALRAAEPREIAQMTVTTHGAALPGGTTTTTSSEEWSRGGQWRSVTSSSAGDPVYDEGFSTASPYTLVSYLTRTWARQPGLGRPAAPASGPAGCESVVAALPLLFRPGLPGSGLSATSPLTVATDLRAAVSCGTLAAAGRQRVDGIEAIQLTSGRDSLISETIWVNPATYLPVRVVVRPASTRPRFLTADITWLPPTTQNLAKLTVPIPAGFRRVPLAEAVTPASHSLG
jgi:hypothetical protein